MTALIVAACLVAQFGPSQANIGIPRLPQGGVAYGVTTPRSGSLADGSGVECAPYYLNGPGPWYAATGPGHWVYPVDLGPSGIPYGLWSAQNPAGLVPFVGVLRRSPALLAMAMIKVH
jgi:hypothetical protein